MDIFREMEQFGHEEVVFWYDKVSGLKAVIAIHDTTLGPALGGLRMWDYGSEEEAVTDVLRLSRGMTYKNAAMGLDNGGAKAIIWADPRQDKSEEKFRSFGRLIHSLHGRYITAEDIGITAEDMAIVARESAFVGGLPETSGDPSPATVLGVLEGMKAAMRFVYQQDDFQEKTVAIQGLGHVGRLLATELKKLGAQLIVTDLYADARSWAAQLGAQWVKPEDIYGVAADVFAPCALGAILNDHTIPQLQCKIIAGSANNQLKEPRHGQELLAKGIVYVPDYVINGGGVINVADEFERGGYIKDRAYLRIENIGRQVQEILETAARKQCPTQEAADALAEERIAHLAAIKRTYIPE
ncbi:MAG: leucine dehydrogenase [Firmicutes bacterium]|nr:leucine dehydrogenase [Bacillota bacterium]